MQAPAPVQPTEGAPTPAVSVYLTQLKPDGSATTYLLLDPSGKLFVGEMPMVSPAYLRSLPAAEILKLPCETFPTEAVFPLINNATITRYTGSFSAPDLFIKAQPLLGTAQAPAHKPAFYGQLLMREMLIADEIAASPHANLCEYKGAIVHRVSGRVMALAYKRYSLDLHHFVKQKKLVSEEQIEFIIKSLESGMKHLHSIGLVHCDLRPVNIFLLLGPPAEAIKDGEDSKGEKPEEEIKEVVLGDFDACVKIGEKIKAKLVTERYRLPGVGFQSVAKVEVDQYSLLEVEKWLWEKLGGKENQKGKGVDVAP